MSAADGDGLEALAQTVEAHGRGEGAARRSPLRETPLLAALQRAGTQHLYGDTADVDELAGVVALEDGSLRREIDGNTVNQPLVRQVLERELDRGDPRRWAIDLEERRSSSLDELVRLLYTIVCARIGDSMVRSFASGRDWEVSLQLPMQLGRLPERARELGRMLRRTVPSCLVKVPFRPDAPECLLVARDLELEGVPVNLTSTFSARQAVVAALAADASRTNIFMGRLGQGLRSEGLGEHVVLEAQRALRGLRASQGTKTQLIVASMREWRSFVRLAGCDVFTAPCEVLRAFLEQEEVAAADIACPLERSSGQQPGVPEEVSRQLGPDAIARLYRVEPELVEFLRELRASPEYAKLDAQEIHRHFDAAGFADLFHAPDTDEREELARGKLPELDGLLVERVPLDTHYSLLANADFERNQAEIDTTIRERLGIAS